MITICKASINDINAIQSIAHQTWPKVYKSIITQSQIEYMLDLFYAEEVLLENITKKGHVFLLIKENDQSIGFTAFEHQYLQKNVTRIHKLYLLPEFHGKGFGKILMDDVIKIAKASSSKLISLNVNKVNPALTFYKKAGFEIVREEKLSIGQDFFMDDYVMELEL